MLPVFDNLRRALDAVTDEQREAMEAYREAARTMSDLDRTIENREKVLYKCEVEGRTTILWIIPEGTQARKGDVLVRLDGGTTRAVVRGRDQDSTVVLGLLLPEDISRAVAVGPLGGDRDTAGSRDREASEDRVAS